MTLRFRLLALAIVACLLVGTGCRTARNDAAEMDALLNAVSYDTSVPRGSQSVASPTQTQSTPIDAGSRIADRTRSLRQAVDDGLKTTAYLLLLGVIKVVEWTLGSDDDDDEVHSPRGQADRNFNQWIGDRERWRRED